MIEAWIVTPLYIDEYGYGGVPQLYYDEPDDYYFNNSKYKVERIAYLPLEGKNEC